MVSYANNEHPNDEFDRDSVESVSDEHTFNQNITVVKIGGSTKRWQGAFELSKILSNPDMVPKDDLFVQEMISAFNYAEHDRDARIRQYLAIAMGATGDLRYVETLLNALDESETEVTKASTFALGNLGDKRAVEKLIELLESGSPQVRLQSVIALGKIGDPYAIPELKKMLMDIEPNVKWDAAIALAKQKDASGKRILLDLLDRKYLDSFPNIDPIEQSQAMMTAIAVSKKILDDEIKEVLVDLMENDINMKIRQSARNVLE